MIPLANLVFCQTIESVSIYDTVISMSTIYPKAIKCFECTIKGRNACATKTTRTLKKPAHRSNCWNPELLRYFERSLFNY